MRHFWRSVSHELLDGGSYGKSYRYRIGLECKHCAVIRYATIVEDDMRGAPLWLPRVALMPILKYMAAFQAIKQVSYGDCHRRGAGADARD